jgi:hypothetical protein
LQDQFRLKYLTGEERAYWHDCAPSRAVRREGRG